MSDVYGNRPMIGGEHYYKAVETPNKSVSGSVKNPFRGGIPGGLKVALAVVAGILAVAVIGGAVVLNLRPVKTARAVMKTVNDGGYIVSDIKKGSFTSNKCTLSIDGNVAGYKGNVTAVVSGKTKQVYGSANVPFVGSVNAVAEINSKSVKLEAPGLDSHTFVYKYTKDNSGFLVEQLGKDGTEALNEVLKQLYEIQPDNNKDAKALTKMVNRRLMSLNYTKGDTIRTFVDGKPRKCAGTKITITGDDIYSFAVDVMDYVEKEYKDEIAKYNSLAPSYEQFNRDDILKEIGDECHYMTDIVVCIYTYRGKVAAVEVPDFFGKGDSLEVQLKGGDYRLQNVEINEVNSSKRNTLISIEGKRNKSEESLDIYVEESLSAHVNYNHKTGDFTLAGGRDLKSKITGNMSCKSKGIVLSVDIPSSADLGVTGDITISYLKGAKLKKFTGEEFDLGAAGQGELLSLIDLDSIGSLLEYFF